MNVEWLRPSAITDLAQLVTFIRPAIRTQIPSLAYEHAHRFAWQLGCFAASDSEGFVVFSRCQLLSRQILILDRSRGDHTYALGRAFGYPRCCCRAAACVGDEGLDRWAREVGSRRFIGRFKAIDPIGYQRGQSLISHVPCSERCLPSLSMALALKMRLADAPRRCRGAAAHIVRSARAYRRPG